MRIHYLYSDKRVARAAIITFDGERQQNAVMVDDETGMLIRRKFRSNGLFDGNETLYGDLVIELPAGVRGGPYKTKPKK
jgi:hypothetical protein